MNITNELLLTGFIGFIWGLIIPSLSSRFSKFMPADPSTSFVMMFHRPRFPKAFSKSHKKTFKKLWKKLILCSFFSAILMCVLFVVTYIKMYSFGASAWFLSFLAIISLLSAIDLRFQVLPDVLTVPLLILGFAAAVFTNHISVETSISGALFGYFVPLIAGSIMHFRRHRSMGGGDFKMLAALGAWLGIIKLSITIIISAIVFIIFAFCWKKASGPYGQALSIGAIISLLFGNEIIMMFL